jgi:hypothetical protein
MHLADPRSKVKSSILKSGIQEGFMVAAIAFLVSYVVVYALFLSRVQ